MEKITVDLDSTVITRYGEHEGSKVGYNPQKRGRASHHPLVAFMAETRMVINALLREGNTVPLSQRLIPTLSGSLWLMSNIKGFLEETMEIPKTESQISQIQRIFADNFI